MANLGNVPAITTSAYNSQVYDGTGTAMGLVNTNAVATAGTGFINVASTRPTQLFGGDCSSDHFEDQYRRRPNNDAFIAVMKEVQAEKQKEKQVAKSTMRMVQVFIADPNDNVPLDDRMIYRGNQHLTDATDQELFFEINIMELLNAHNAKRVKVVDKSVKDRVEYLEPVKIRDLRMVVVNVATF